jgi:ankyrin repeat protein
MADPIELKKHRFIMALPTHSLLHIAVARGDIQAVEKHLEAGLPVDLLAADGLAPLHWALAQKSTTMPSFLIQHGSPADVRSAEGATPPMTEVQNGDVEKIKFLLDAGADPNAINHRGFSALHRAAEIGNVELTQFLLGRGARADVVVQGHTPPALAEKRGHAEILELLKPWPIRFWTLLSGSRSVPKCSRPNLR